LLDQQITAAMPALVAGRIMLSESADCVQLIDRDRLRAAAIS
jgi:hypothetical protein